MGQLNIYQGLSNEYKTIRGNGKLKDLAEIALPELDISKAIILKSGETVTPDYEVKDDDLIFIRYNAGATVCAVIAIVTACISLGAAIYGAIENQKALKEQEEAQRKANALSEQVTQLPFLKGANNRTALGYNIPFIMGSMYNVPYKLCSGFYSIAGENGINQYWHCNFVSGYNNAVIQNVRVGTIDILTANKEISLPDGTTVDCIDDSDTTPYKFNTDSTYYDAENRLDVKYTGAMNLDGLEDKVKSTSYSDEIDYDSATVKLITTTTDESFTVSGAINDDGSIDFYVTGEVVANTTIYGEMESEAEGNGSTYYYKFNFTIPAGTYTDSVVHNEPNEYSATETTEGYKISTNKSLSNSSHGTLTVAETVTDNLTEISESIMNSCEGVSKQLETNTYKIDVCIAFNGLRYYDDGWEALKVEFDLWWTNGDKTWHKASTFSTGSVNSRKTVRINKTITFDPADCYDKDITIKLIRKTPLKSSNSTETGYLAYINCWSYDAENSSATSIAKIAPLLNPWRDRTARIGLKLIANDSTKDSLDEINVDVYGCARVWYNGAWTTTKYPTRNPAAWVLEVMTSDIHPHSKYSDSEIDLAELGAVYEYCAKNEFYCDGIITEDTKKRDVLTNILNECNSTMYLGSDGVWHFAIEQEQETPVALLNENCIKSVNVSKSFERRPYAFRMSYTNRDSWEVDTFYQNSTGKISSQEVYGTQKIITENSSKYITSFEHAFKYNHRMLAKNTLQPREITVQVGHEGDYYPLYSKILLQMTALKIGLSKGVIHGVTLEEGKIAYIETSDECDFTDTSKTYGIIIQSQNSNGRELLQAVVTGTGKTKLLTLAEPLSYTYKPEYGNIYSFGYLNSDGSFSRITNEMMIYETKPSADGWELKLKDYNEAIFDYGTVPAYKPNLTIKKETGSSVPAATYGDIQNAQIETEVKQKNVTSIIQYYYASTSNSTVPEKSVFVSDPTQSEATLTEERKYLWTFTRYFYSNNTYYDTTRAVVGVYGNQGAAGSGYILDLSPENQTVLAESSITSIQITANLYHDTEFISGATLKAYINNVEVGTWSVVDEQNIVTIPYSLFTTDYTAVTITADYTGNIHRYALATVTKVYAGQSPVLYKILVSSNSVKKSAAGVYDPTSIEVTKRKVNTVGESSTEACYVTAELDGSGEETKINYYENQAAETYDSTATYYEKVSPFLLLLDDDSTDVLGNGINPENQSVVGGVFYD